MSRQEANRDGVSSFRQRLRDKGLVPKEVWIRPEYAEQLKEIESKFREKRVK